MIKTFRSGPHRVKRLAKNDESCGWIATLPPRPAAQRLKGSKRVEWAVVGAGLAGLSAAARLSELFPGKAIAIIDAQRAGECSSGRNSGFAIGISPPRGVNFADVDKDDYAKKLRGAYIVNQEGQAYLRSLIGKYGIECDWQDVGKIHAAVSDAHAPSLNGFADILDRLEIPNSRLDSVELRKRLGTSYYSYGIWAGETALIQPAALTRRLAQALSLYISVYEESPVEEIDYGDVVTIRCPEGVLIADNVIVATNGLMGEFGLFPGRSMHLSLTSCLTRPLTQDERAALGLAGPWGVLSVSPLGSTVRYTSDHRLMLRSTSEYWPALSMSQKELNKRAHLYDAGINVRWPGLSGISVDYIWSGIEAVSGNMAPVFAQMARNVFAIGVFNASGVSRGAAFGKAIVDHIAGLNSPALGVISKMAKPTLLPPRPFLDIGVAYQMAKMRKAAIGE